MKRVWMWVLMIATAGFLFGCATIGVPEKTSSDDCLVVIKTRLENPDDVEVARYYHLNVSGHKQSYPIPKYDESRVHIVVKDGNTRIESISTGVHEKGYKGEYGDQKVDAKLPYEPGEVLIYDLVFVQRFEKVSARRIRSGVGFTRISSDEKQELLQEIAEDEAYESWR